MKKQFQENSEELTQKYNEQIIEIQLQKEKIKE